MNWINSHRPTAALIAISFILLVLVLKDSIESKTTSSLTLPGAGATPPIGTIEEPGFDLGGRDSKGTEERIVIKNSNLSILVKDVRKTSEEILSYSKSIGGYMVTSSFDRPDESPFATVTVRVPTEKLDSALEHFKSLGLKVTSENLVGTDVTQEFKDIDQRLSDLEKTRKRLNTFFDRAKTISEILSVQRELETVQREIDSLKGQKQAIEQNAALTKITVFLSTDELALPYAPNESFRPALIFKQAVRSVLTTLRAIATLSIWVGVYAVFWVPALIAVWFFRRWWLKRQVTT